VLARVVAAITREAPNDQPNGPTETAIDALHAAHLSMLDVVLPLVDGDPAAQGALRAEGDRIAELVSATADDVRALRLAGEANERRAAVEPWREPRPQTSASEPEAPDAPCSEVGFELGEVDPHGELELILSLDEKKGSAWLSQEMWQRMGEVAGWSAPAAMAPSLSSTGTRSPCRSTSSRPTRVRYGG
jgi:hypothetical protein